MPYRFLEEVAIADIAFRAWGASLEEVFICAGDATMNVMIESLDSIEPRRRLELQLEESSLEMLLFDFLQELIFYKDSEQLLCRGVELDIRQEGEQYTLKAVCLGEELDPDRHEQRVDVKAVTLHQFRLEQMDDGWSAHVILDI